MFGCEFGQIKSYSGTVNEECATIGVLVEPKGSYERSLVVTRSLWSGWDRTQPESETVTYLLNPETKTIQLTGIQSTDIYTLNVNSYNKRSVNLTVAGVSVKPKGQAGIDFTDCESHDFTILYGEEVELDTCTMDVGVVWIIKYQ